MVEQMVKIVEWQNEKRRTIFRALISSIDTEIDRIICSFNQEFFFNFPCPIADPEISTIN
jgi:hypothetical protein